MKRSELILDMATKIILEDHRINWKKAQELAETCLKRAEEVMIPNRKVTFGEFLNLSEDDSEYNMKGEYYLNTWEPEDEEK